MFKESLMRSMLSLFTGGGPIRILDLGCGIPTYMETLLNDPAYKIEYVGIEPDKNSYDKAVALFKGYKNVTLYNDLAYKIPNEKPFDICCSLSVFEHIKNISVLVEAGAKATKKGGFMVHSYDLGHSLYPISIKEKLQVFLGNNMGWILPEHKFVAYVSEEKIKNLYKTNGIEYIKTSSHQMRQHKSYQKLIKNISDSMLTSRKEASVKGLNDWEFEYQDIIQQIPVKERELLFPTVCVWGKKN